MDKEFLEDYERKERELFQKGCEKFDEGSSIFGKDIYPPESRFRKLQHPVTLPGPSASEPDNLWAQVPFSGSVIFPIPAISQKLFELSYFQISEIPKMIDFIKDTGKIQIVLNSDPTHYVNLDYLDPFFKELNPPVMLGTPLYFLGNSMDADKYENKFDELSELKYKNYLKEFYNTAHAIGLDYSENYVKDVENKNKWAYIILKLFHSSITEQLEDYIVNQPEKFDSMMNACKLFITMPLTNMIGAVFNYSLQDIKMLKYLPEKSLTSTINFPCEIGKFLIKKLTYAPLGIRSCYELMDHYDAYDLEKIQSSLNEAIINNSPDMVQKNAEDISNVLDNIWNDKTIPRRIKELQIGIPLSMAAIGTVAAGPIGSIGGFLAGLGYNVLDKAIDISTEGISERTAKLRTKNYQINIYEFKQKYALNNK